MRQHLSKVNITFIKWIWLWCLESVVCSTFSMYISFLNNWPLRLCANITRNSLKILKQNQIFRDVQPAFMFFSSSLIWILAVKDWQILVRSQKSLVFTSLKENAVKLRSLARNVQNSCQCRILHKCENTK